MLEKIRLHRRGNYEKMVRELMKPIRSWRTLWLRKKPIAATRTQAVEMIQRLEDNGINFLSIPEWYDMYWDAEYIQQEKACKTLLKLAQDVNGTEDTMILSKEDYRNLGAP